ncbi:helix-turn-helix domain-containing protein [Oceaniovalibus sp. ACAM 378]|uniref:helix-turn-helix domain-containing protein n=1 Tax=Oceaniovalibus sp. ACAM 378 TaxID=2599923 RepID=UPI0011DBA996|nr:helix-turn-helix transcriptional regulator [Oceaniovalibus sp. ACAM 378]TYB83741.1 helix-turn-helix transcriptional regulator [Oceaniovalibus sp. ACAM 378]
MKHKQVQPQEAEYIDQRHETSAITYESLLLHVRERRRVDLENEHPGRATNINALSNTTRSLTAFMEANGLSNTENVGDELVGTTHWDSALKALGQDKTAKRRRAEMNVRVRPWAIKLIRASNVMYDGESFGERLYRFREAAGLSQSDLANALASNGRKPAPTAINNWEKRYSNPGARNSSYISDIEKVLGISPGALLELLPSSPYRSESHDTGLPRSLQRRITQHLPTDFNERSLYEQDEILAWVSANILSTPKEILEDESTSKEGSVDLSIYSLTRNTRSRLKMGPAHLLEELDEIQKFKTSPLVLSGMKRNEVWGPVSAMKADDELLAFMGALHQIGLPEEMLSLSAAFCPQVIDTFIEWRRKRRGGYTRAICKALSVLEGLLHGEFGYIVQSPGFGERLAPVRGLITEADARLAQENWIAACTHAKAHLTQRIKEVAAVAAKGRDPFEALMPVLEAEAPLNDYYKIVHEIRRRMPDDTYPVRKAEALRGLMMLRLGLELGFRQKNNRELLICPSDRVPRTWKVLTRLKRGEISFDGSSWLVRMPGTAFKNASSKAVNEENTFVLMDQDGFYSEIEVYLEARRSLLGNNEDPGTFFVKRISKRSKTPEYNINTYYEAFRAVITTYGIHNPYTDRGAIRGLRPHGPHSVRHVLATASVKKTRGFSDAAALLLDSEKMVREAYARFLPGQRHSLARNVLWSSIFNEGGDA